jgi:hypothetical protein
LKLDHKRRGLLDHPLEPVIGLAEGETLWRLMTPGNRSGRPDYFGLPAEAFLHSDMNFLRSLPWTPLASASFEHCSEAAVRGFSAFFSAGAIFGTGAVFAAGAGVAGVAVCAKAELMSSKDATAVAAAREENVIMTVPRVEDEHTVAA